MATIDSKAELENKRIAEAVAAILKLREDSRLDGLKIVDLIREGRKY